jgi:hypothetical protein
MHRKACQKPPHTFDSDEVVRKVQFAHRSSIEGCEIPTNMSHCFVVHLVFEQLEDFTGHLVHFQQPTQATATLMPKVISREIYEFCHVAILVF